MTEYSIEFYISFAIFIIVAISFSWQWQDRRKKRPDVHMTLHSKHYFNVTIFDNASYNLKVKKAYKGKFWFFRKRMSIGTTMVNNKEHSDSLAKQKLGNIFNQGNFNMYLELDEDISEKTFYFKTNSGTCKYIT